MKLLIAEDEFFPRKALIKTIEASRLEVFIAAECETGTEALEYLKEQAVDLVITDICMPGADGLEVSKFISENCPDTRVILVTGYADFSYAQKAIKYHVTNYITKPVKDQELISSIEEILVDKLRAEKRIQNHRDSLMASTVFNAFTASQLFDDHSLYPVIFGDFLNTLEKTPWLLFLAQSQTPALSKNAGERLQEFFMKFPHSFGFYLKRSDEYLFLLAGTQAKEALYLPSLAQFLNRLALCDGLEISVGVSRLCHASSDLKLAYEDCISSISRRLLETPYGFFPFIVPAPIISLLSGNSEFALKELLSARDLPGLQKFMDSLCEKISQEKPDRRSLEELLFQIYTAVNYAQNFHKTDTLSPSQLRAGFFINMSAFRTLSELKKHLMDIFERICTADFSSVNREIAEEMLAYIHENYAYNISLNDVSANHFFMNPNYLGRLFKSHTGTTFTRYLIDYRISCAKELLKNTDIKITDIAARVGFSTTSHFGYTFKKYAGYTPEQYRKQVCRLDSFTE